MTQPDSIPAEWIQGAENALCSSCETRCVSCKTDALAVINFLRPLIEAETRERCAQIAEDHAGDVSSGAVGRIASALRAEGKAK